MYLRFRKNSEAYEASSRPKLDPSGSRQDLQWACPTAYASIPKFVFDMSGAGFEYKCTTSQTPGRRDLKKSRRLGDHERRALYETHSTRKNKLPFEMYTQQFYSKVTKSCKPCGKSSMKNLLMNKLLDSKLAFLKKVING